MDLPIYTPKTTAELLGIPPKALRSALAKDHYSAQDLWALRKALRLDPKGESAKKLEAEGYEAFIPAGVASEDS